MCIHNSLLFTVTFLSEQNAAHRRTFLASRSLENTVQSTSAFAFDPDHIHDACLGGAFYI